MSEYSDFLTENERDVAEYMELTKERDRWSEVTLPDPRYPNLIGPIAQPKDDPWFPGIDRGKVWDRDDVQYDAPDSGPDKVDDGGDNGNYYDIWVSNKDGEKVLVRCLDVIEELNMTFSEGEAFKAVWRKAAARLGRGKQGSNPVYDAKKIRFYGESIERMALKEENDL